MSKPRLLWVGDAGCATGGHTGFSRITHAILDRLCVTWDVHVLAINCWGDPYPCWYKLYPARAGGDLYGVGRFRELADRLQPDVICMLQDSWIVAQYLEQALPQDRLVAYIPVDAPNQRAAPALNRLDLAIFYTDFGVTCCRESGYTGPAMIVPHGVDRTVFTPQDRQEARLALGMAPDLAERLFLVGGVNRNQHRKRFDLTLFAFQALQRQWPQDGPPLRLLLHTNPTDVMGYDLIQLRGYLDLGDTVLFTSIGDPGPDFQKIALTVSDAQLATLYNAMDVHVNTAIAEGWSLTVMESMACGIPQVLPQHSALAEWAAGAALFVPAEIPMVTPGLVNTVGRAVDPTAVAEAILALAQDASLRQDLRTAGLVLTDQERFTWNHIAARFDYALHQVAAGEPVMDEELMAVGMAAEEDET